MTRSQLIKKIINQLDHIPEKLVKQAVKEILYHIVITLSKGEHIEIRGFGSFSLHYRASRIGRNPQTGDTFKLQERYIPYFKPCKRLRNRINMYI